MDDLKELLKEVGKNVEDVGRMLQRKPEFTIEQLTELKDSLRMSSATVGIVANLYLQRYQELLKG